MPVEYRKGRLDPLDPLVAAREPRNLLTATSISAAPGRQDKASSGWREDVQRRSDERKQQIAAGMRQERQEEAAAATAPPFDSFSSQQQLAELAKA